MCPDLNDIQGKPILIDSIKIGSVDDHIDLEMTAYVDNKAIKAVFCNVSRISMAEMSFPMQISGFEILDNQKRGWDSSSRYYVHDYEDGTLQFYCEKILR